MNISPNSVFAIAFIFLILSCKKESTTDTNVNPSTIATNLNYKVITIGGKTSAKNFNIAKNAPIKITFSAQLDANSIKDNVFIIKNTNSTAIAFNYLLENNDSTLSLTPTVGYEYISSYTFRLLPTLKSKQNQLLNTTFSTGFTTAIDSSNKFDVISDDELLTLVQKQTFKYFWDFGHPTSGMARERNSSGDIVTSGGTGFGIMAMIVAIERGFITRQEGLARLTKMVDFLTNSAIRYHGAYPHWLNGATGATIAFSTKDNGADLVETSFLFQGLLTARQYFDGSGADELALKTKINTLWNNVEWNWFTKNNENALYWHWSPTYNWDMNMKISGYNEALITYVLAASSTTHTIAKAVYDNGWTRNGSFVNNKTFYNTKLPLGYDFGGPLFFTHYSFLGLNPNLLTDKYTNYYDQGLAHSVINFNYCKANPKNFNGYSADCWGLTASDNNIGGYSAHDPNNDLGIISPTAALSSFPYTPTQSMAALKFFYYKLGDKIWKQYGFVDAFNLTNIWYADSFLAIDQGPIIVMIENHRSKLLWNLFMSCPEVENGLVKLGLK
ncbi:MAG: glucoamylase family protein [Cytophagales bacterium]